MNRVILFYVLFCTVLTFTATGSTADSWERTSPCGIQSIGRADENPYKNVFTTKITKWKRSYKYTFHGELAWDTGMRSTQGRIILRKKGTTMNQRIADWSNPPETAVIEQDITKYIDGKGTYTVEWKYMDGRSGVCIMRSEIAMSN